MGFTLKGITMDEKHINEELNINEHLLSNLSLNELLCISDDKNTLKLFSEHANETLKLQSQDGWSEGEKDHEGWVSCTTSYQEEQITLLLKGIDIEYI